MGTSSKAEEEDKENIVGVRPRRHFWRYGHTCLSCLAVSTVSVKSERCAEFSMIIYNLPRLLKK